MQQLIWATAIAIACVVLGAPRLANASASYPPLIKRQLGMAGAESPCTVCHNDLIGGNGTVVKPFGRAMIAEGLQGANPGTLAAALDELRAQDTDSDGDGQSDVEELIAGTDPNDGPRAQAGSGSRPPTPSYGCGMASFPTSSRTWLQSLGLATLFGALAMARRRDRYTVPKR